MLNARLLPVICLCLGLPASAIAAQQTEEQAPLELQQQDQALQAHLQWTFSNLDDLAGVQVRVTGGVVRLEGEAASWEAREKAGEIASSLGGVIYVDNSIEASREVETRLAPALQKTEQFARDLVASLPLLLLALLVLGLAWLASRLVARWERIFRHFSDNQFVQVRVRQLVQTLVMLLGVLLALEILGITAVVGAILGTAGIAGIILGFAFKDIVENYLAGLLLSLRQPFAASDHVRIGDYEGKVVRLTSRETILMTLDGNHVRLPNSQVFGGVMLNFSRNPRRRFQFGVGVGVNEDLSSVQELGLRTLREMPGVLDEPPPASLIQNLGDSSVQLLFMGWVDQRQADFGKVRSEAIRLLKTAFDEASIEMPEPIYKVKMEDLTRQEPQRPVRPQVPAEKKAVDISVDTHLDQQIEEDRQESPEDNLLQDELEASRA